VFESLNRRLNLNFASTHAHGFASVVLERYFIYRGLTLLIGFRFLLEQLVLFQLERRSDVCADVSNYLKTTTPQHGSKDRQIGDYFLKSKICIFLPHCFNLYFLEEIVSDRGTCYYKRFNKHGRLFTIFDDNIIQSRVTVKYNNQICFGELIKIFYRHERLRAKVRLFSTTSIMDAVNNLPEHEDQEVLDLSADISRTLNFVIDENVQLGADGPAETIKVELDDILGHCLVTHHASRCFYFNVAMKAECK
jgi:hypothetical protein